MAVVDGFGDGGEVRGAGFSTDRESAFSFFVVARGEWWLQGFCWDVDPGMHVLAGRAGQTGLRPRRWGRWRGKALRRTR